MGNLKRPVNDLLIVTLASPFFNYGGFIQSVSLSSAIERYGFRTYLLTRKDTSVIGMMVRRSLVCVFERNKLSKFLPKQGRRFVARIDRDHKNFEDRRNWINTFPHIGWFGNVSRKAGKFTNFVVGSDQVFRAEYFNVNIAILSFLGTDKFKRRIVYAASFGNVSDQNTNWLTTEKVQELLKLFSKISFRENSGKKLFERKTGLCAEQMPDPCFLLSREELSKLFKVQDSSQDSPGNTTLAYGIDLDTHFEEAIKNLKTEIKLIVSEPMDEIYLKRLIQKEVNRITVLPNLLVKDFLGAILSASRVVTNSFHGVVLSLIFEKDFVVTLNEDRGTSRITELLETFGLLDRIWNETDEISILFLEPIDWKKIRVTKQIEKERGLDFLKQLLH
jgi:hypothetical protein